MKEKQRMKRIFSYLLLVTLIAALALTGTACGKKPNTRSSDETARYTAPTETGTGETAVKELGTGKTAFRFSVVDLEGNQTDFKIKTDEKTVGAALVGVNLIAGDTDQYGLMVKTVNGIVADYEKDGCYWAFYVDGKYASAGVDTTPIDPDAEYMMKVEKA